MDYGPEMTLQHDEIRQRAVSAALKLIDEGGLENVHARKIAKMTDVSVGTLYNLFGSIDGLLEVVNAHTLSEMNRFGQIQTALSQTEISQAVSQGWLCDDEKSKLTLSLLSLAKTYIDFVEQNANRWAALLTFSRTRDRDKASSWYLAQQNTLFDLIGNVLDASGLALDETTRLVASRALWSAVHGIVTLNYAGQENEESRKFAWQQIEFLVKTIVDGMFANSPPS